MQDAKLTFPATIHKLGINPCVDVPVNIVETLLQAANKKSTPVQVKCDLNGTLFDANVVRVHGQLAALSEHANAQECQERCWR
jgi:hypothetical protein